MEVQMTHYYAVKTTQIIVVIILIIVLKLHKRETGKHGSSSVRKSSMNAVNAILAAALNKLFLMPQQKCTIVTTKKK